VFQFSSDAIAPHERFEVWGDFLDRTLMPIRIEPAKEHPFYIELGNRFIGDVPLVSVAGAGCLATRGRLEIARSTDHFYLVSMHLSGVTSLTTRGIQTYLAPGDVFLIDTMNEVKFGLERPYHHLLVKFPKKWLDARLPRVDQLFGSVLSHTDPLTRLYTNYLAAGFQLAEQLPPAATTLFCQHLIELLSLALAGSQPDRLPSKAWRAAIFVHACRVIALKFSDPALSPDLIARTLGISTRMLHRIFAEHDEKVMQHVLKVRVERAAKLIASAQSTERPITHIAFVCGFNDLTHFGRAFSKHMGMTPTECRRQARSRTPELSQHDPLRTDESWSERLSTPK